MDKHLKRMAGFLRNLGAAEIAHTESNYLAHAIGVYRDLESWGCDEHLCRAGLFHSVYGTQKFQRFTLPLQRRDEVRELIGERAERLAYLNCAMQREAFDRLLIEDLRPFQIVDRFTGERVELSDAEFRDLCTLHLCDWLEQVARADRWSYRREPYRKMAKLLGGVADESYRRVFAGERAEASASPAK